MIAASVHHQATAPALPLPRQREIYSPVPHRPNLRPLFALFLLTHLFESTRARGDLDALGGLREANAREMSLLLVVNTLTIDH